MVKNEGTFSKRFEKKFIIPARMTQEFMLCRSGEFAKQFQFDHFVEDQNFTVIENIHFDSEELESYHQHMNKSPEREKLRIRSYASNGLPEELIFFELKSKRYGETFKSRIALKRGWLRPFLKSGKLPVDELIFINEKKSVKKLYKTVERINEYVHTGGYVPMLLSSYVRFAFKLKGDGSVFRLTFDQDLRTTRINFSIPPQVVYPHELNPNDMILEVKMQDPAMLDKIPVLRQAIGESQSFSKYCYGVYNTRERFLLENRKETLKAFNHFRSGALR